MYRIDCRGKYYKVGEMKTFLEELPKFIYKNIRFSIQHITPRDQIRSIFLSLARIREIKMQMYMFKKNDEEYVAARKSKQIHNAIRFGRGETNVVMVSKNTV